MQQANLKTASDEDEKALSGLVQLRRKFFTKTYCQGMKVIVFGKCNRPRGLRPVELMTFNKIYSSLDSETNG